MTWRSSARVCDTLRICKYICKPHLGFRGSPPEMRRSTPLRGVQRSRGRPGQAIADYLRYERPRTTNQAVFVRRLAPHDAPISPDAVHRLIRDAYQRIGLKHGRTHALRHTLARQLLEQGSSLKEVADILRHRSLDTSLIYAKLDSRRLSVVALPWPGSTT